MSQVIVTNDKWKNRRKKSADQEHAIQKEDIYKTWRRNDISKGGDPIAKVLGILSLPIVAAWAGLLAIGAGMLTVATWICRGVGALLQPLFRSLRR